jgi:hypothetical protein
VSTLSNFDTQVVGQLVGIFNSFTLGSARYTDLIFTHYPLVYGD